MSASEENKDNDKQSSQADSYYSRKKNWVGGVDNDELLKWGLGVTAVIAGIAAYPVVKQMVDNFSQRFQQQNQQYHNPYFPAQNPNQPPANGALENYIPPTEPQAQPVQPQTTEQSTEQTAQPTEQQQQEEDSADGRFYDKELRSAQRTLGKKKRPSYESPFGADIGGFG